MSSILSRALIAASFSVAAMAATGANAGVNSIWGNSASGGAPYLNQYDLSGNLLQSITGLHGNNGRGVVQVGDVLYYTSAGTNGVYGYNSATNTDLGTVFSVAGATGLATMAYDGSSFYIGDYSGTNNVYKFGLTGTPEGTISLANCTGFCDGLEYVNGKLVSNRSDGGHIYDVYDLSGNLLVSAFITDTSPTAYTTGIAFDGSNYYVSHPLLHEIAVFDSAGAFDHNIALLGGNPLIEDLSVNYSQVLPGVPEPATWGLMILGMGLAGASLRRRRTVVAA